ncbi:hypothetical protein ABLV87_13180, partial [Klebsiella sp. JB_Kp018]|uniref:hypothetical protein n=1 Tax=Klebsiella sp. JB_Kp018 TaxID=3153370 RepID=UPI0032B32C7C
HPQNGSINVLHPSVELTAQSGLPRSRLWQLRYSSYKLCPSLPNNQIAFLEAVLGDNTMRS